MEVQFKVIQVFSSVNIAKTFWIKDFFEDYSVKLTNQQKTKNILFNAFNNIKSMDWSMETVKLFPKGKLIVQRN